MLTKDRSIKSNSYFHVSIEDAYRRWPKEYEFQPESKEHLRAWLLCKVGHRDIIGERLSQDSGDLNRMASFLSRVLPRARDTYCFATIHNEWIVLVFPKSTNFATVDEIEFRPIAMQVYALIDEVLGTDYATEADNQNREARSCSPDAEAG